LRFATLNGKTVLEVTGNYYAVYPPERMDANERIRQTFERPASNLKSNDIEIPNPLRPGPRIRLGGFPPCTGESVRGSVSNDGECRPCVVTGRRLHHNRHRSRFLQVLPAAE